MNSSDRTAGTTNTSGSGLTTNTSSNSTTTMNRPRPPDNVTDLGGDGINDPRTATFRTVQASFHQQQQQQQQHQQQQQVFGSINLGNEHQTNDRSNNNQILSQMDQPPVSSSLPSSIYNVLAGTTDSFGSGTSFGGGGGGGVGSSGGNNEMMDPSSFQPSTSFGNSNTTMTNESTSTTTSQNQQNQLLLKQQLFELQRQLEVERQNELNRQMNMNMIVGNSSNNNSNNTTNNSLHNQGQISDSIINPNSSGYALDGSGSNITTTNSNNNTTFNGNKTMVQTLGFSGNNVAKQTHGVQAGSGLMYAHTAGNTLSTQTPVTTELHGGSGHPSAASTGNILDPNPMQPMTLQIQQLQQQSQLQQQQQQQQQQLQSQLGTGNMMDTSVNAKSQWVQNLELQLLLQQQQLLSLQQQQQALVTSVSNHQHHQQQQPQNGLVSNNNHPHHSNQLQQLQQQQLEPQQHLQQQQQQKHQQNELSLMTWSPMMGASSATFPNMMASAGSAVNAFSQHLLPGSGATAASVALSVGASQNVATPGVQSILSINNNTSHVGIPAHPRPDALGVNNTRPMTLSNQELMDASGKLKMNTNSHLALPPMKPLMMSPPMALGDPSRRFLDKATASKTISNGIGRDSSILKFDTPQITTQPTLFGGLNSMSGVNASQLNLSAHQLSQMNGGTVRALPTTTATLKRPDVPIKEPKRSSAASSSKSPSESSKRKTPSSSVSDHNPPSSHASNEANESPSSILKPLSAYNYFFTDQRDRIIRGLDGHEGEIETMSPEERKRWLLSHHWSKDRTKRRRHRKTHGKIDFTTLSKLVGQKWRELSEGKKQFYRDVAYADMDRYEEERSKLEANKRRRKEPKGK